jgi:membrane-bound serine protease (ClpP class)
MNGVRCTPISCRRIAWLTAAVLLGSSAFGHTAEVAAADDRIATLVDLDGPIGPAMSRYIERALADASSRHSPVIILQMDTPGGLDTAMRDIIKAILASPVPVVSYVAPSGARAASAGTYILYASHLAAMAPATNLGAATPISIGGEQPATTPTTPTTPTGTSGDDKKPAPAAEAPATAGERKAVNDAVAYIRALAQLRGRNADWAESAVRGAASLSANDALQQHVIEIIAKDVPDLLLQLNGRKVQLAAGERLLDTRDLAVNRITPDSRTRVLLALTHPTIAYGLLLIGIYGLLLEGYNPGAVLPGVVGALSLLLALYGFQLLAVNYAGLALIALGLGLIIAEFFMPAFGSLGVGGLAAFVIGSIMLFDNGVPGQQVALPMIMGIAVAGAVVIAIIAWLGARARRRPVTTGAEAMIGAQVEVTADCREQCVVRYGGELWNARSSAPLTSGQRARIIKITDLTLWIEPQPNLPKLKE